MSLTLYSSTYGKIVTLKKIGESYEIFGTDGSNNPRMSGIRSGNDFAQGLGYQDIGSLLESLPNDRTGTEQNFTQLIESQVAFFRDLNVSSKVTPLQVVEGVTGTQLLAEDSMASVIGKLVRSDKAIKSDSGAVVSSGQTIGSAILGNPELYLPSLVGHSGATGISRVQGQDIEQAFKEVSGMLQDLENKGKITGGAALAQKWTSALANVYNQSDVPELTYSEEAGFAVTDQTITVELADVKVTKPPIAKPSSSSRPPQETFQQFMRRQALSKPKRSANVPEKAEIDDILLCDANKIEISLNDEGHVQVSIEEPNTGQNIVVQSLQDLTDQGFAPDRARELLRALFTLSNEVNEIDFEAKEGHIIKIHSYEEERDVWSIQSIAAEILNKLDAEKLVESEAEAEVPEVDEKKLGFLEGLGIEGENVAEILESLPEELTIKYGDRREGEFTIPFTFDRESGEFPDMASLVDAVYGAYGAAIDTALAEKTAYKDALDQALEKLGSHHLAGAMDYLPGRGGAKEMIKELEKALGDVKLDLNYTILKNLDGASSKNVSAMSNAGRSLIGEAKGLIESAIEENGAAIAALQGIER